MELYKLFYEQAQAEAVAEVLGEAGIPYKILATRRDFDPSFAFNEVDPKINLLLPAEEFAKANEVLKQFYAAQAQRADPEYYLFAFNDKELLEIVRKQDIWGAFDVALAIKILGDRGITITPEVDEISNQQRLAELAEPDDAPMWMLVAGYLLAFISGFGGFVMGRLLIATKVLPDGTRVPVYKKPDQVQGRIIMTIGIAIFLMVIVRALWHSHFLSLRYSLAHLGVQSVWEKEYIYHAPHT